MIPETKEFEFKQWKSAEGPFIYPYQLIGLPGFTFYSQYQFFKDGRIGVDGAIRMPLNEALTNRNLYLYVFAVAPDPTALAVDPDTMFWLTLKVKLFQGSTVVKTYTQSLYYQPGGPPYAVANSVNGLAHPAPSNQPSAFMNGGDIVPGTFQFTPTDKIEIADTVGGPEPDVTNLQPLAANFPASALQVDIYDTTMTATGVRIVAISDAW